jgi:hypothetical protein
VWSHLFSGDAVGHEAVWGGKSLSARNGRNLMPLSSPALSPWHRRRLCTRSGGRVPWPPPPEHARRERERHGEEKEKVAAPMGKSGLGLVLVNEVELYGQLYGP